MSNLESHFNVIKPTPPNLPDFDEYLERKHRVKFEDLKPGVKNLINRVKSYTEEMRFGRPITAETAAASQGKFLLTLYGILELEPVDAMMTWDILLYIVLKNKTDVFADELACRFFNRMPVNRQQPFLGLMNLIIHTADARTRKSALRNYPIKNLEPLLNEKQLTNIYGFYANTV